MPFPLPTSLEEKSFLDDEENEGLSEGVAKPRGWIANFRTIFLGSLLAFIAMLELWLILTGTRICLNESKEDKNDVLLYSPAQDVVEYEIQTPYSNVDDYDISPFWKLPSPELDQQWEDLYHPFGISRIPRYDAALLPNKTSPIPGDEQHYVIELDVFHELHCLNMIRQALYPNFYPHMRINSTETAWHIGHCLDSIRQSLMCSVDISILVWQWNETFQETAGHVNVAHVCRRFDKIQEWAKKRELRIPFDKKIHVKDDIVIPVYHSI